MTIVTIDRPAAPNAVNPPTAALLADAFRRFDVDASQHVAILTGAEGTFCAGYDLKQMAAGHRGHRLESGDGPMGPTRLMLGKPVIAAVEGHPVADGLELAESLRLAHELARLPQAALRNDRRSALEQWTSMGTRRP